MNNINMVVISGRLTRDPEIRSTSGGTIVMTFSVAVNDRRRNQQTQQWEDYTNFLDCTMFGARADSLSKILKKGMLVCVQGRLRWSAWERDGQKRSKIEIIVDEVELMSRTQGQGDDGYSQSYAPAAQQGYSQMPSYTSQPSQSVPSYSAPVQQPPMDQVYDEDIPF